MIRYEMRAAAATMMMSLPPFYRFPSSPMVPIPPLPVPPAPCIMQMIEVIGRLGTLNLGCCILPSKVVSDIPFLGRLWTDLAENLVDF